jgi:multicomponent Na+:H+ antiporter subunit F
MTGEVVLGAVVHAALALMAVALLLAFGRLLRGPTVLDRVVALDLIAILAAGLTVVSAIHTDQPALLDAAIAMALVGFLGTVAISRYIEKRTRQ